MIIQVPACDGPATSEVAPRDNPSPWSNVAATLSSFSLMTSSNSSSSVEN